MSTSRLLTWDQMEPMVPYCRGHIYRLERAGQFPARLQIGPGRVAWRASEVEAWLESRERGPLPLAASIVEHRRAKREAQT